MKQDVGETMPSIDEYFLKAERGDDAGSYFLITEFDSKITRDLYYPKEGDDRTNGSEEIKKPMASSGQFAPGFSKPAELAPSSQHM